MEFRVKCKNSSASLFKVIEVMILIASYDSDNWPSDTFWEKVLPSWFIKKIKLNGIAEVRANENLWHFGSWLGAMKFRGWEWFSSKLLATEYSIFLEAKNFPFAVNPLEYVIMESGIELSHIDFKTY